MLRDFLFVYKEKVHPYKVCLRYILSVYRDAYEVLLQHLYNPFILEKSVCKVSIFSVGDVAYVHEEHFILFYGYFKCLPCKWFPLYIAFEKLFYVW